MRKALLGLCGLAAAGALFGTGYLVHDLTAGDGGNGLSLTGSEASARAEVALRQSDPSLADTVNIGISCEVGSFNTDAGVWSINCSVDNRLSDFNFEQPWSVNATTGEAAPNWPVGNFRLILTEPELE